MVMQILYRPVIISLSSETFLFGSYNEPDPVTHFLISCYPVQRHAANHIRKTLPDGNTQGV